MTLKIPAGVSRPFWPLDTGALRCLRRLKLIEDDHVFAFAGNSIFDYAGAEAVSKAGVPDVGGQPIGNEYDQYQHLYSIYGSSTPRDGTVGWNGICDGHILDSPGVKLPLRRLQGEQAATTLSHVVCPPRERGSR